MVVSGSFDYLGKGALNVKFPLFFKIIEKKLKKITEKQKYNIYVIPVFDRNDFFILL